MKKYRIRVFPHKERLIYMPQVQYKKFFFWNAWKDCLTIYDGSGKINNGHVNSYGEVLFSEHSAKAYIEFLEEKEFEQMDAPKRYAKFAAEHPERIIELDDKPENLVK